MVNNIIDWRNEEGIFYKAKCIDAKCPKLIVNTCKTPCIGLFDDATEETEKFTKLINLVKDMS